MRADAGVAGTDDPLSTSDSGLVPVLIVGAGPTGLTLAVELARRRVPFRLIERQSERPTTSRAIGTQARTVEVFRLMGIPETALEPAVRPRALRFAERDRTLARVELGDRVPGGLVLISMDEADTERVLEERLEALGGRVERGVELLGFRREGDGVVARVRDAGGATDVRARFLAGADGAHSTVRHEAGISFAGSAYPEQFLLADLDLDWALPHEEGHIWIGDDGVVAVVPLPGERRYRVIVPLAVAEPALDDAAEAEIASRAENELRRRTGLTLPHVGEPAWASAFRIHRRIAERYRDGPVFLMGDAAHVHSPVGGQGMNTGIQDAFNLGWKLALAAHDQAAPGLLDSYETERHDIAQSVLRGTHLSTRLVLARNPVARAFRERFIPVVMNLSPVRRRILQAVSQLSIGYHESPLSIDVTGKQDPDWWLPWRRDRRGLDAGERVPDATLLDPRSGQHVSLFDRFSRGWTLLLFPGEEATPEAIAALDARARETREAVGDAVQPILMMQMPPVSETALSTLIDATGEVTQLFGARDGLVALVRPDGYLGYRGRPHQAGEPASYLARVFAMRLRGLKDGG